MWNLRVSTCPVYVLTRSQPTEVLSSLTCWTARLRLRDCFPMIGQTISHYRISAELGRGGMGVVYRAHDERLLRSVAIKILSDASCGSAETRSRMLAEARAASNLHHPWNHDDL